MSNGCKYTKEKLYTIKYYYCVLCSSTVDTFITGNPFYQLSNVVTLREQQLVTRMYQIVSFLQHGKRVEHVHSPFLTLCAKIPKCYLKYEQTRNSLSIQNGREHVKLLRGRTCLTHGTIASAPTQKLHVFASYVNLML